MIGGTDALGGWFKTAVLTTVQIYHDVSPFLCSPLGFEAVASEIRQQLKKNGVNVFAVA